MKSRIMYIERKAGSITGEARIGRVEFSKTGRSMYYKGQEFIKTKSGYKHNCIETSSNEEYWISGCKKDGSDALYSKQATPIDDDIREEYWTMIRNRPELKNNKVSN
ncbi:hypothetical protein [Mucilaginibacter auburnensis]|uniref:1-deoxy-D-xylulose-5-phosphate synthase n=1 Tax=Mucilaginibacter auburnensis TaxID=1457233 RepID=A0A2H9VTU4_9SPHI|nr:hypothetical protein [Mucilaginibacter auburnensis]PJJ84212.1 hypothetical protein CLV57_1222 [Mucilaginibacter auburnensis]